MPESISIIDDPSKYGTKGQSWHPNFVAYMVEIATHPTYAGMPDAVKDDGKIQWEAPSNRSGGQYQYTHDRRLHWWQEKAGIIGVDTESNQWISTVAKRIHPTGEKPCKRCGRVMRIAYVYPNRNLQKRMAHSFGDEFDFDPLEPVTDVVQRIADNFGQLALLRLHQVFSTHKFTTPGGLDDVDSWVTWLEDEYIPKCPSLLSPGAMSNPPDRFDGFHSFNQCCRKYADTGRHDANMRSYTTDRRVFEFWSDGDWIAADRMMGLISASMRSELCADGGDGSPTADHIGPLSLGFAHRPHFRLLSSSANSSKNNRMTPQDVVDLLAAEAASEQVVSWYARPLWDLRKEDAITNELALRLSRVLRDNQRYAMHMLLEVYRVGQLAFLAALLGLNRADYNVEFKNLRVEQFVPVFDEIIHSRRQTRYAAEQKARRLRIGFEALRAYGEKENRHALTNSVEITPSMKVHLDGALAVLMSNRESLEKLSLDIGEALADSDGEAGQQRLRDISGEIPNLQDVPHFLNAWQQLVLAMSEVARVLSGRWETDRYVRVMFEEFENE